MGRLANKGPPTEEELARQLKIKVGVVKRCVCRLAALRAQGLQAFEAAALGVWLHARAGVRLGAGGRGLAARDLMTVIREVLEEHAPCLN